MVKEEITMMRKVYSCNVCEKEKDKDDLKAYYVAVEGVVIKDNVTEEGKHICTDCIKGIHEYEKDRLEEENTHEL
jgi:hypothetical protein